MHRNRTCRNAAALLAMLAPALAFSHDGVLHTYEYAVTFDGRGIGTHRFDIVHDGGRKRVRSVADFHVRVLFLSLHRYYHEAEELWQDGCLRQLASQTNDNGDRFAIELADTGSALYVTRLLPAPAAERIDAVCPATFAYWDPAQLQREALINSQTGTLTSVQFTDLGEDAVDGVPARRYRLHPQALDPIDLWYRAADGVWLQLETRRERGTLRYRLHAHERVEPAAMAQNATL